MVENDPPGVDSHNPAADVKEDFEAVLNEIVREMIALGEQEPIDIAFTLIEDGSYTNAEILAALIHEGVVENEEEGRELMEEAGAIDEFNDAVDEVVYARGNTDTTIVRIVEGDEGDTLDHIRKEPDIR